MASGFFRSYNETYVIEVRENNRRGRIVEKKRFYNCTHADNYDQAMNYLDAMEKKYDNRYTVEFNTNFI